MTLIELEELDADADRAIERQDYAAALHLLNDLISRERVGRGNPWLLLSACLRKAKALHQLEREKEAYLFLAEETPRITKENHAYQKEYWDLLADVGEITGHGAQAREARGTAQEIALDWTDALERAEELRSSGRDEESLVFYERSLRMNPGEAGTRDALESAAYGKVHALLALDRKDEARRVLAMPWVDKDAKDYKELLDACGK